MKRLRILTGKHVGAHLDLADGTHRVGPDHECDIAITDWTFAPLRLVVAGERVVAHWEEAGRPNRTSSSAQHVERKAEMLDLEPREFDGTVLCIGNAEQTWPSDVQLLSSVFAPTPKRVAQWAGERLRFRRRFVPIGIGMAVVIAVTALAWPLLESGPPPVMPPSLEQSRDRVQHALDGIAKNQLSATVDGSGIQVTGMVEDGRQAAAVREAISKSRGPYRVTSRFSVASDIAETIRSTPGLTNPSVTHVGRGVFNVAAEVVDERAARAALDRMSADLAPAVQRITANLEKVYPADPLGPILSHSKQDGLSVVQTRDGVKHIVLEAPQEQSGPPASVLPQALNSGGRPALRH